MQQFDENLIKSKPLLLKYQQILLEWQKKVNLISNSTINDIWQRHIMDSAQLYPLIPSKAKILLDVGSGAGFPGIVLAILNKTLNGPLKQVFLVESDLKKSLFLQEVNRQLGLNVEVLPKRMESVDIAPDVITARAVAAVPELLKLVDKNVSRETLMLFLKGKNVDKELQNIPKCYMIQKKQSLLSADGCVLMIRKGKHG
ncbi:MAG: 16S rRNA (guanine(527)-N(7))-methyltransferase RsmG [Alphaproteobacteria bacterium]|nr:16S rRNA (guanine(527)-N(7))-methyltransferase RsmG [Alphaproteobacteria bacterium]